MKLFKYGLPLAAVAMLASCSNDNVDAPVVEDPTPVDGLYVGFNLAIPNVGTDTRANFEAYDDGVADEYAIDNVYLYLFRAMNKNSGNTIQTSEMDAELYFGEQVGVLSDTKDDTSTSDAITKLVNVTFQLNNGGQGLTEADKTDYDYYALIIVNKPGSSLTTPTKGQKFSEWIAFANNHVGSTAPAYATANNGALTFDHQSTSVNDMLPIKDGDDNDKTLFTMTNAPLYNTDGTTTYLAKLNTDKFKTSPKAATEAAATVYVQRGVAKVALNQSSLTNADVYLELTEQNPNNGTVTFSDWALNVVNTTAFPVQKVDAATWDVANKDWFLSKAIDTDGHQQFGWAIDPNMEAYENAGAAKDIFVNVANESQLVDKAKVAYALENTMEYNGMQKCATTQIIFKGQYKLANAESVQDFIMYPGTDKVYAVANPITLEGGTETKKPAGKEYKISDIVPAAELTNALHALGASSGDEIVWYYPNGVTYYTALIRHFTGTNEAGAPDMTVTNLNQYQPEHRGRYGIVRNNSYEATVGKVFGYGSPTIPTPDDTPDDNPDPIKYNVQLDIKVLAWTKRGYSYTIK